MYVVIDGAYELYRAHYAFKKFVNHKGFHNGAIYGFLRSLNSLHKHYPGTYVVTWEGHPKSRHEANPDYKSNRDGLPDEVRLQLKPLESILRLMGIMQLQHPDWESDDLLATMAAKVHELGEPVILVTGDDDLLQCVSDNEHNPIMVYNPRYKILYHEKEVMDKYKVTPAQLSDLWAIQGDESDCIHGVKRLGAEFPVKMIWRYGSLEDIFKFFDSTIIDDCPGQTPEGKKMLILKAAKEQVFKNKAILALNRSVPDMIIDEPTKDMDRLKDLFLELKLNSFARDIEDWSVFNG